MKKFVVILTLILGLLSGVASAQTDPRDQSPVVVFAAQATTATSDAYAVIFSAAGEAVWFHVTGTGITGDYTVEGTLDAEATVKAGTAVWFTLSTGSTLPTAVALTNTMPYVRVKVTRTAGTFRVLMRGSGGTRFRKVE